MIDLHCHVLPGIDDGPETIEDSLALARVAVAAGIDTIVATPHVNARTPNDAATIARLVAELNARLADERLALERAPGRRDRDHARCRRSSPRSSRASASAASRWLLVEPPFTPVAPGLQEMIVRLLRDGHRVVLAHPERCPALHRDRSVVRAARRRGRPDVGDGRVARRAASAATCAATRSSSRARG